MPDSARKARDRDSKILAEALASCGDPGKQAVALTYTLQKKQFQAVGVATGVVTAKVQEMRVVADRVLKSVKVALHHEAVKGKHTNEALPFRDTIAWTIVPTALPLSASM
jgi:hypothetical protein